MTPLHLPRLVIHPHLPDQAKRFLGLRGLPCGRMGGPPISLLVV